MKNILKISFGLLLLPSLISSKSHLVHNRVLMNQMTTNVSVTKKLWSRAKNIVSTNHAHQRRELFKKIRALEGTFQLNFNQNQKKILDTMVSNIVNDNNTSVEKKDWKNIENSIKDKVKSFEYNELKNHREQLEELLININTFINNYENQFKGNRNAEKRKNDAIVLANLQVTKKIIESFQEKIQKRENDFGKKAYHGIKNLIKNYQSKKQKEKVIDAATNLIIETGDGCKKMANDALNNCKGIVNKANGNLNNFAKAAGNLMKKKF